MNDNGTCLGSALVGIEDLLIAGAIGICTDSLIWGIVSFLALRIAHKIPVLRGILAIVASAAGAYVISQILSEILSAHMTGLATLSAFYILMALHGAHRSDGSSVYALMIMESLVLSVAVLDRQGSISIACAVFAILIISACVPILRVIGRIALSLGMAFLVWEVAHDHMAMGYSILMASTVLAYTGYHHAFATSDHGAPGYEHDEMGRVDVAKVGQDDPVGMTEPEEEYYRGSYHLITHKMYQDVLADEGSYGEYLVYERLKHHEQSGAKFLFNCYLAKEDGRTSEIDVMLICQGGIFVFESKNYSGWIWGDGDSMEWTQVLPSGAGRSKKIHFYNPVKQNETHIRYLKDMIGSAIPVYSVVVFSDKCTLKSIRSDREDAHVIQCRELKTTVDTLMGQAGPRLDAVQIHTMYERLYPSTQVSNEVKEKHIENVEKKRSRSEDHDAVQEKDGSLPLLICPLCGSRLVIRVAQKGEKIGSSFYGCAAFPECRYSREIDMPEKVPGQEGTCI